MFKKKNKSGKAGDRSRYKSDEVSLADAWIIGAILQEGLVFRVAFKLCPMASFSDRIVPDVRLVVVTESQDS